jgi:hypothetical protein
MPSKRTTNIRGKGGKRPGAGRPKGAINKVSKAEKEKYAASGEMPLDYMMRIMRDSRYPKARRDEMAKAAAPYFHAKLSSVEVKNKKGEKFRVATADMTPKEAMDAYMSTLSQPTFEDDDETRH